MTLLPLWLVLTMGGLLGLAVGSFLNVVVHRVPAGLSVAHPPSACPGCENPVRARDNIPVVSWLLLRGRCRDCAMSISGRYPLVEGLTGAAFAVTAWRFDDPVLLPVALIVVGSGIALAMIDLDHGRLPFAITTTAAALITLVVGVGTLIDSTSASVTTALLSTGIWLLVYGGIWLATLGRGMGLGDVALAPVLGAALGLVGLSSSLVGLMGGFVIGAVVSMLLLGAGRIERGRIPHGPFMLAGAVIGMFAGQSLGASYLGLVGLG